MKTPAENYAEANRLMARVASYEDPTIPYVRALTAQAAVYAELANYRGAPGITHNVTVATQPERN